MSKKKNKYNKADMISEAKPRQNKKNVVLPKLSKNHLISLIAILAFCFICFMTVKNNGFVNWDDDRNCYENVHITSLGSSNFWENTKEIFSTHVIGNYNPLSIWTFAIEKKMYGLEKPGMWHLTNLFMHLISVFLIFRICLFLGLRLRAIIIITLLFAIHPMRVESVAWLTERKDVLFGMFYLGAILQYIKYKLDQKKSRFILIYLLFVLSLFSKIQAVILPLSLLCVDYYFDHKISIKGILSKAPLFILSLIFGIVGIYFLSQNNSLETNDTYHLGQRIFIGSYSLIIYLIKVITPYQMSPLYPYPASLSWEFFASIVAFPAYFYLTYKSYKAQKHQLVFGLSFFFLNIVMLLQILGAGQGFIADRFTYIAYFGLFFVIGYYIDQLLAIKAQYSKIGTVLLALVFLGYGYMTHAQSKIWQDSGTMWTHVLKYYKNAPLPYGNRANFYRDKGLSDKALADYNKTISLKPTAATFNSRARLYFDKGNNRDDLIKALSDYSKAIEMDQYNGEYYINRGATYAKLNNIALSLKDLDQGLKYKPDHSAGYINRSIMHQYNGRVDLALLDLESYIKLNPYNADIWYEKARANRILKNGNAAINDYSQAIKLNANKPMFYYERSRTYYELGYTDFAIKDLKTAMSANYEGIDPSYKALLGL